MIHPLAAFGLGLFVGRALAHHAERERRDGVITQADAMAGMLAERVLERQADAVHRRIEAAVTADAHGLVIEPRCDCHGGRDAD